MKATSTFRLTKGSRQGLFVMLLACRVCQGAPSPEELLSSAVSLHQKHSYAAAGSKLELFCRQRRPGFEAWGAEPDYFPAVPHTGEREVAA